MLCIERYGISALSGIAHIYIYIVSAGVELIIVIVIKAFTEPIVQTVMPGLQIKDGNYTRIVIPDNMDYHCFFVVVMRTMRAVFVRCFSDDTYFGTYSNLYYLQSLFLTYFLRLYYTIAYRVIEKLYPVSYCITFSIESILRTYFIPI